MKNDLLFRSMCASRGSAMMPAVTRDSGRELLGKKTRLSSSNQSSPFTENCNARRKLCPLLP
jgi:hypothetical protein